MAGLALDMAEESVLDQVNVKVDTLRTLAIPYNGGLAVLPNNLVVEVLPYAPSLGIEHAPVWVIGSMVWKAMPLPLVSLEYLATGDTAPSGGVHNRIIVVQAINDLPKLRCYGFVGSAAPRIVDLKRRDLSADAFRHAEGDTDLPFQRVLMQGERAIVPAVDDIEAILSEVIRMARSL